MIKAISFDADGTLMGTFPESPRGFENFFLQAANAQGANATLETLTPILARLKRETAQQRKEGFLPYISEDNSRTHWLWYYEEVFRDLGATNPKELAQKMIARYQAGEFTRLYADTLPCLEYFATLQIPMIVISNFSNLLGRFLTSLGIAKYFKGKFISESEGVEKPHFEIFLRGAQKLALHPHEILHVGNDLEEDYYGAKDAGFQAVLLDRDGVYANETVQKINTLLELFPLVETRKTPVAPNDTV